MIELFVEQLSVVVQVSRTEAEEAAKLLAASISACPHKSRDRDSAQIARDVASGIICELGIAKLLGKRNTEAWNVLDRSSYSYDVIDSAHGKKHEVKHQFTDYWSFSPEVVKTLINNLEQSPPDTIITVSYKTNDDGSYVVRPRLIIDSKHFRAYMRRSQFKPGTFYYDHKAAAEQHHCIVLSAVENPEFSYLVGVISSTGYAEVEIKCREADMSKFLPTSGSILFTRRIEGDKLSRKSI